MCYPDDLLWYSYKKWSIITLKWWNGKHGAERSPLTNVIWVWVSVSSMSYVSRVVSWFSPVLGGFFFGCTGFSFLHKNQLLNSNLENSGRIATVLCEGATAESIFIFMVIYLFRIDCWKNGGHLDKTRTVLGYELNSELYDPLPNS